ncbi:fimbrial protein [Pseudomonas palleroniana]
MHLWVEFRDYQYGIKFIALSNNIPRGTFSISTQQVGNANLPAVDTPAVSLSGFSITYEQTGCIASVSPSILGMGVVSPLDFSGVGSTVSGNLSATVSLQCDDGLGVYASMTDQNNIGNSDSILSLSQSTGNAATGVGVRFVREDNSVVSYGPSSSFVDPTSTSQWQVKSKSDSNNSFSFTLRPEYIQTESSITAGDANALVSITFAYD